MIWKKVASTDRCPKLYLLNDVRYVSFSSDNDKVSSWKILCNFLYHRLATKMNMQDCHSTSLEPLACCQNVGQNVKTFSKYHFYRSYFGRCSSELAQLVPLPFYWGRSTFYSDSLHDLSVALDVTRMCMSKVSFLTQLDSGILCL